jgi:MFS family permease
MSPARLTFLACSYLVLNLLAFMTVAAVLPTLIDEWRMSNAEAGWLGGVFFAGYLCAVPVLVPLTDRVSPRRVCLAATAVGALSSLAFAAFAGSFWSGLLFRFLAGVAVAGAYMPALKIIADTLEEPWRSRASSYYTSVFALGTAFSIFVGGAVADALGWRYAFALAGAGNLVALIVAWRGLPAGRFDPGVRRGLLVDFRPVFRNREALAYICAYAGHVWEVFANRIWIVAFFAWLSGAGRGEAFASPVVIATLAALLGVPVAMAVGEIAARGDRRRVLGWVHIAALASGAALVASPLTSLSPSVVAVLAILYGMAIYGDTGAVSAGTVASADPALRGATMAVHATIGFVGATLGPAVAGVALDLAGGRQTPVAWSAALAVGVLGGLMGPAALRWIGRRG